MAVNLTPQYFEAEEAYKKARTAEERLECLRRMWVELPKHKASEKLQAELKTKIADLKKELEKERRNPSKKGGVSYKIPRQGAGQVLVLGGPNVGKSCLLTKLTRATPEVAPFPFTTREPSAGMMTWEDVRVQLVDTPPITADFMEGYLSSMVRSADAALLLVDLADDDGPFIAQAVLDQLASVKTVLTATPPADPEDPTIEYIKTQLIGTKCDADGASDRLEIVREMLPGFTIQPVDLETGTNLETTRTASYQMLGMMRVYTKRPGKPADMESPFTLPIGGTVLDLAEQVHREVAEKLKSAKVWGSGVFDGQTVTRDHVLNDKDIVELHS